MVEMGIDLKRYEKPADNDVKIKKRFHQSNQTLQPH